MKLLESRDVAGPFGKAMRGMTVGQARRVFGEGVNGVAFEYKKVNGGNRARLKWSVFEPHQIGCLLRASGRGDLVAWAEGRPAGSGGLVMSNGSAGIEVRGKDVEEGSKKEGDIMRWVSIGGDNIAGKGERRLWCDMGGVGSYYKISDMAAGQKPYDAYMIIGGRGYAVCRWSDGIAAGWIWAFDIVEVVEQLRVGGTGIRGDQAEGLAAFRVQC